MGGSPPNLLRWLVVLEHELELTGGNGNRTQVKCRGSRALAEDAEGEQRLRGQDVQRGGDSSTSDIITLDGSARFPAEAALQHWLFLPYMYVLLKSLGFSP